MRRSFGISLLLLSSGIVLGGGGGYLVHSTIVNPIEKAQIGVETESSRSSLRGNSQMNDEHGRQALSNGQSVVTLEDPKLHTNSYQRKLAIYSYVAGLSVQELTGELEGVPKSSQQLSQRVKDELQTALVERLAIENPETAVKFAVAQKVPELDWATSWYSWQDPSMENEPAFMPVVQSLFTDWALTDLDSAISKAKSLSSDAKSNALSGILATQSGQSLTTYRQLARELGNEEQGVDFYIESFSTEQVEDPEAAWNEVITLIDPNDFNQSRALINIARQWYEQDGFSALDEIRASTLDSNIKSSTLLELLSKAAEDNPEQAFQYAQNMPSEGVFSPSLYSVVNTWAESDPQAAMQAVNNIKQSGQREQLQRTVARTWAMNEPRYVLGNLDIFSSNVRDNAKRFAIVAIARTSPKEAAELALKHTESNSGNYLHSQVLGEWLEHDVEAAVNWVYSGPVSKEQRYTWVSALTGQLVSSDPRRAFDLARKQEIPEESHIMSGYSTGLEADVIRQIAYENLELAEELLPRVREGMTKTNAYTHVGNRYIDEGHSTKALNLGLKLSSKQQASYFPSISYAWARIDPEGFIESIESIPSAELRSSLARSMVSDWSKENFTEAQLKTLKQYLTDSDRQSLEN